MLEIHSSREKRLYDFVINNIEKDLEKALISNIELNQYRIF